MKRIVATAFASFWLGVTLTGLWVGCGHGHAVPKMVELAAGDCVVIARQHADAGVRTSQIESVCATLEELAPLVDHILNRRLCRRGSCGAATRE